MTQDVHSTNTLFEIQSSLTRNCLIFYTLFLFTTFESLLSASKQLCWISQHTKALEPKQLKYNDDGKWNDNYAALCSN